MKFNLALTTIAAIALYSPGLHAQPVHNDTATHLTPAAGETLYIDVHRLGPGKVTAEAVAGAHAKDLAVQSKYGVHFLNYWVDEAGGNVYCLSSSVDTQSIRKTHAEAHGLLPDEIYAVTQGLSSPVKVENSFFLDIHEFNSPVKAKDVAAAHKKDLAVEGKYGVNFINYWVSGNQVFCLSQAPDSAAIVKTHKEAHGLIPAHVMEVVPGQK
jgi:hypothetical protein